MFFNWSYNVTDTLGMENADPRPLPVYWIRKFRGFNRKYSVLRKLTLVAPHLCSSMIVLLKEYDE